MNQNNLLYLINGKEFESKQICVYFPLIYKEKKLVFVKIDTY